ALKDIPSDIFKNKILVSAVKGVIPDDNLIVSDFITKYYNVDPLNIGVIGGPCHSEEVALERLSFLTFGFKNIEYARQFADFFRCRHINTRISDDVDGIEYAAILKNIFAIASGMSSALGYGDNFQAVLIANAIQEMKNFIDKVSPAVRDINQPVYLGDLLVTAYSQFSRNRTFGHMIGKGYSVKSAQLEMNMIAEGYFAVKCINMINSQLNVNMAITSTVYNIIYNGVSPKVGFKNLSAELN
ncbi:MAG: glycerol-3-phosphate dehydrogenase, partial [Bacteroidota bacterium]|nr:glycerol-3-phosphate dehydrogenase [Bacteroidota bacterium]